MATTYTGDLGLPKPDRYTDEKETVFAQGDDLLNSIVGGFLQVANGDANYTLQDGVGTRESRTLALKLTSTLTAARNLLIDTTTSGLYRNRLFIIWNAGAGNFKVTVKTTAGGSTGVEIENGFCRAVWHDGTNVYALGPQVSPTTGLIEGAWTSWTPTWTNLTIGNATVVAKYSRVGKLVHCRLSVVLGSTSSVTGDIQFSLPVNRAAYGGSDALTPLGQVSAFDTSSGSVVVKGCVINYSVGTAGIHFYKSDGTYLLQVAGSSTVPFTWATGDEINCEFSYEAA